jgi:hypothetical protein
MKAAITSYYPLKLVIAAFLDVILKKKAICCISKYKLQVIPNENEATLEISRF